MPLDPGIDANQILRERLEILDLDENESNIDRPDISPETLASLTKILEDVRASFWLRTKPELQTQLEASDFSLVPELEQAHARLMAWVEAKPELSKLQLSMGSAPESIFPVLQSMVGQSPRVLAVAKEQIYRSMQRGRYKNVPAEAARIQRDFPAVFRLDPDWFRELIRFKRVRVGSEIGTPSYQAGTNQSTRSGWSTFGYIVIVVVVIRFLIQLTKAWNR